MTIFIEGDQGEYTIKWDDDSDAVEIADLLSIVALDLIKHLKENDHQDRALH